ncbi:MAG: cyclopropane-fatty-acyl-phospholipid synthase family protein [Xanthobacteraceae bacterium]
MTLSSSSFPTRDPGPRTRARPGILCRFLDQALPALQAGRLQLVLPNGEAIYRSGDHPGPAATVSLRCWRGLWRILMEGENGVSNGYLDGDWSTPDLSQLLELGMHNGAALTPRAKSWLSSLTSNRILHFLRANTRRGSRRNIAAHYDLGNNFFLTWLDAGMNYSSALYAEGDTLEDAQMRKLDRAASLLDLKGSERVLEIGCGWGGLAERLIRRHGSTVLGVTLSTEQLAYAQARLAGAIRRGRADLRLMDYRDIVGRYDRIASIEMLEAVGERYWPVYFAKLRSSLRNGGIAVLQVITIDERRFAGYRKHPDFIQRHIFPGGQLPTASIIEREAARAGLKLVHWESFGDSYAKTLREWRSRFLLAWPIIEPLGFNERFRRTWEYYLTYCEIGFRFGVVQVGFFKFVG